MSLQLKNPTHLFPPGGFRFQDPKTGMIFSGSDGTPTMIAANIIAHRGANPTFYPQGAGGFNIDDVIQEMFQQKNASMPWLFVGGPEDPGIPQQSFKDPTSGPGGLCICGSAETDPIYCPTCGGQRITGYKCRACGASRE